MKYSGFEKEDHLDGVSLYCGDCMDLLKQTPDKHYDLCIVDPPYGIDINKSGRLTKEKGRTYKSWDTKIPDKKYFEELFRISKNQIIWGGNYFLLPQTRCFLIWDKVQPEGVSFSMCEYAWTSFDESAKIFRYSVQKHTAKENKIHPTQKPVQLYKWLLQKYAKEGYKILDTHFGSLSIGIACHDLHFELTASELDKEYYELGKNRLMWHQKQLNLF